MNDVPDWLWQNVVADLLTEGVPLSVWLAWKYRKALARTLSRHPIVKNSAAYLKMSFSSSAHPVKVTVGGERQILYDVRGTAGGERHILYNVEAPTPSFARRLEDFGSWLLLMSTS